jgi:hypothetical protein
MVSLYIELKRTTQTASTFTAQKISHRGLSLEGWSDANLQEVGYFSQVGNDALR